MPKQRVGDISINVQQLNTDCCDTIILIHGLGYGSLAMWYFNIAPALSKKYRVVMYDLKSHGNSDQVPTGYDLKTLSDELLTLMNNLGIQKASMIGFSFGTLIALKFTERFSEKVDRLVLIEPPYVDDGRELSFLVKGLYNKFAMNEYRKTLDEKMQRILTRSKRLVEKHDRMFKYLFDESSLLKDLYSQTDFSDDQLIAIDKETLLLNGNQSSHLPTAVRLQGLMPNSRTVTIDGGHDIPVVNPDEVRLQLMMFFEIEIEVKDNVKLAL